MAVFSRPDIANAGGFLNPRFDGVGDAFAQNFAEGVELGAAFAVFHEGERVVDIHGGFADRAKETPWTEHTLACVYSTGKAIQALIVARAVSDDVLDYDAPVCDVWPAFAAQGKDAVTLAQALSHQAGLCGFPEEMAPPDWLNWELICVRLAAMAPLWPLGTAFGYHPQTVGFIGGEVLRRVLGRSIGAILRDDAVDIHCGLQPAEIDRAAFMPKPPKPPNLGELNEFTQYAFLKPWSAPSRVSREDWMAAELPGSNMHATARAIAEFVIPFANDGLNAQGDAILETRAIDAALRERIRGDDLVLPFRLSWSAGLMRNINYHFGPNENAFGHAGFGGSCVVVDPEQKLAMAYVMSKMSPHLVGDPRSVRLINAAYECLPH